MKLEQNGGSEQKSKLAAIHCYPGVYRVIPKKKINIASILKPEQRKG
jgi:hypothetical protein